MSLRTPLGIVLGRGSAREGVGHWLDQRTTAIALLPLTAWLAWSFARVPLADHASVTWWISEGWNPVLLGLTVFAATWHSRISVQTIMEDYIHHHGIKYAAMLANSAAHLLVGCGAIWAIARIALRGPA